MPETPTGDPETPSPPGAAASAHTWPAEPTTALDSEPTTAADGALPTSAPPASWAASPPQLEATDTSTAQHPTRVLPQPSAATDGTTAIQYPSLQEAPRYTPAQQPPAGYAPLPGYAAPLPGYAANSYAPAPPTSTPTTAARLPKRYRPWFWTAMVLALAAIGTGGYFAVTTYQDAVAPETLVRNYLTALVDGDAAAALSYAAPLPEPSQLTADPRSLLTDEVLAAQHDLAPMTDLRVGAIDVDGDHATAHVSYALALASGTQQIDDAFALVRDGREWQLATPAPKVTLELDRAGQRASLAGARVPRGTYYVFPGAMPIALDTDALQLTEDSRVVTFATAATIRIQDVELSERGVADFANAIDNALGECLDGAAAEPTLCPVPGDYRAVPGSMRGTLPASSATQLEFTVQPGSDGNVLALGNLTIDGTYDQLDFNNRRVTKALDDPVRVTVLANATDLGTIVWEFL